VIKSKIIRLLSVNSIGFLQFIGLTKSSEEKGIHQNTSKNFLSIYIFSFDANSLSYKTIQNISIFVIKVSAVKVILLSKEVTLLRRKERANLNKSLIDQQETSITCLNIQRQLRVHFYFSCNIFNVTCKCYLVFTKNKEKYSLGVETICE